MKFKYIPNFILCFLLLYSAISFSSCSPFEVYWGNSYDHREEDSQLGYMISRRWFGDLGVLIDGRPIRGSVLSFVADDIDYISGWGTELDYYGRNGTLIFSQRFEWYIRNGVIYLRYDDPAMDCKITRSRVTWDYFDGYIDGYYFELADYERYWYDYGYDYPYYMNQTRALSDSLSVGSTAECGAQVKVSRDLSRIKKSAQEN